MTDDATNKVLALLAAGSAAVVALLALVVSIVALIRTWHRPRPELVLMPIWREGPRAEGPYRAYYFDIANVGSGPAMNVELSVEAPSAELREYSQVKTAVKGSGPVDHGELSGWQAILASGNKVRLLVWFYDTGQYGINPKNKYVSFLTDGVKIKTEYSFPPKLLKRRTKEFDLDAEVHRIAPG
ncbi:hypothetical protein V1638_06160 [Pseudarthrobacter sp. J64]|uniref:hypothetical protein n=1 Tax=Pseudarthrobacter sp. J64 TaxID=3116485 RepID=UPI002E7FDA7E|nr:hypothetical protein [Pseudarthrobacter sp. J64]MEE2568981.1 hypothetical protein [Pseudarthrobacter sp. J64]